MQKKTAYMVATSHLDTVWRWTIADTVEKFIPDTLSKNFDLIEKYPKYRFNFEGAYRYELIKEYYPKAFEQIKKYVRLQNWYPAGSEYENGDVNIPSPESISRNIMLGNNYFYDNFGIKSKDIFLPDCFGFGAQLPQIISDAGLIGFTTQKLSWGSAYGIPFDIGMWVAPNGKEIGASFNAKSYRYKLDGDVRGDLSVIDGIAKCASETNMKLPWVNHLYGTGDWGGSPTEESVKNVCKSNSENRDNPLFEVKSARSDKVFVDLKRYVRGSNGKYIPRVKGDMLMTNHGAGCYTSRTQSKRLDYQSEQMAHTAEFACSFASLCGTYDYPKENLNKAWKRTIKHQFHDDITGTSLMEVYNDAWDDYYSSIAQFKGEFTSSLQALARDMDTSWIPQNGVAISVSNPTQYRRIESVNAKIRLNVNTAFVKVINKQKQEVPCQIVSKTGKTFEIIFEADVPSYAVHIYAVVASDEECKVQTDLKVTLHTLENSKYKVMFNKNGDLAYLLDKKLGKQIIKAPIKFALLKDVGSLAYPSWELRKQDIDKDPYCYANTPEFEIVENGPARIAIKITREAEYSTITQIVSLYPNSEVIRVDNFIDWRTRRTLLKAVFPLSAQNNVAKYDSGIGYTERGNNKENLYEVPAQKWADITDKSGEFGVSILTDCKHGWDKPDDNTLRLSCIHSPLGAFTKETRQDLQDLGRNCFSFGIYSHKGDIDNGTNKQSMIFARKMLTAQIHSQKEKGEFSQVASLIKMSHDNVIVRAVKISEYDKNSLIVRLNNATDIEQKNAALSVYREFEEVDEVNTSEEFICRHEAAKDRVIRVNLKPFETVTLKIKFKEAEKCEHNNIYKPMRLTYNVKAFTNYDNMKHIIFQGSGYSLPIDLIDRNIKIGGIDFYIPHGNNKNKKPRFDALACRGQKIKLNGDFEQVYILAGAVGDEDIEETFKIDAAMHNVKIKSMTAPYSKWDMYGLNQVAHTDDKTSFGYEFTHLHHPEGNIVKKARIYLYSFNVKNKHIIKLPKNNKIVIFAMTSAKKSEYTNLATDIIDIVEDGYDFGKIPPIDKLTDKTEALTIRAGKIQDQYNGGKGKGFKRDNIITNIIRSYTKSEW